MKYTLIDILPQQNLIHTIKRNKDTELSVSSFVESLLISEPTRIILDVSAHLKDNIAKNFYCFAFFYKPIGITTHTSEAFVKENILRYLKDAKNISENYTYTKNGEVFTKVEVRNITFYLVHKEYVNTYNTTTFNLKEVKEKMIKDFFLEKKYLDYIKEVLDCLNIPHTIQYGDYYSTENIFKTEIINSNIIYNVKMFSPQAYLCQRTLQLGKDYVITKITSKILDYYSNILHIENITKKFLTEVNVDMELMFLYSVIMYLKEDKKDIFIKHQEDNANNTKLLGIDIINAKDNIFFTERMF